MRLRTLNITIAVSLLCLLLVTGCQQETLLESFAGENTDPADDPWGAIVVEPGQPLKLGFTGDLSLATGRSVIAIEQLEGVRDAANDVLIAGQYPVVVEETDTGCRPESAVIAAQSYTNDASVPAVVGDLCSEACIEAAPIYEDAGFLMMSGACGSNDLTNPVLHSETFFRTIYDNSVEGRTAADFAFDELGARRVYIVSGDDLDSREIAEVFGSLFESNGGEVVGTFEIDLGDESAEVWPSVSRVGADLVYLGVSPDTAADLLNLRFQTDFAVLVNRNARTEWFTENITFTENLYATGPSLTEVEGYTSYGYAAGYDATSIILRAVDSVAVIDKSTGNLEIGRQALYTAVLATASYDGLSGDLTCTSMGECSARESSVSALQADGWTEIYVPN